MSRSPVLISAVVLVALSPSAHADFVVASDVFRGPTAGAQVAPGPGVISDAPHWNTGDRRPGTTDRRAAKPPLPPVQGFGDQVPLAFACRQIVPHAITVTYGPGADPGMLVTWRGGDAWPRVLGAAIRSLGLRMVETGTKLEIRG